MGMAASQARLLSITSRMSDNELRAQLINNAKIRLTEDSSKASEKYINALNQTQLMMSNKDALGNNMYSQLTFNNLTAYSSYNNQYGLINKSGELVVSELDAAKYESAIQAAEGNEDTDALTEFLRQYGIEKDSTSYWESNGLSDDLKARYEGDIEYDDNGNRISGYHYGYEMSLSSTSYGIYQTLLDDYLKADKAYTSAVIKEMKEYLYSYGNPAYKDMYSDVISGKQTSTLAGSKDALDYLTSMFNDLVGKDIIITEKENPTTGQMEDTAFYTNMNILLNSSINFSGNSGATITSSLGMSGDATNGYDLGNGAFTVTANSGTYSVQGNELETGESYTVNGGIINNGDGSYSFNYTCTSKEEDEETGNITTSTSTGVCTFNPSTLTASTTVNASVEDVAYEIEYIYKYFNSNVISQMNRDEFASSAPDEKAEYEAAAKQLSIFIFGYDIGSQNYDNLDDMEWIINSGLPTTNLDSTSTVTIDQVINGVTTPMTYQTNFEAALDVYLCELMIDEYGTPKYTWVDVNNPNENADAKAQWYTNLFNKMQEDGYQSISIDLCKSSEWIQYALESGLLSMVQVDDEYQWISTMYSNCSDITEDTIDLLVTQAEAEYTRENNKIQAKDQLYDLELKNIDTEHEALQTEYDSIKSALDKNVERMFKYFS